MRTEPDSETSCKHFRTLSASCYLPPALQTMHELDEHTVRRSICVIDSEKAETAGDLCTPLASGTISKPKHIRGTLGALICDAISMHNEEGQVQACPRRRGYTDQSILFSIAATAAVHAQCYCEVVQGFRVSLLTCACFCSYNRTLHCSNPLVWHFKTLQLLKQHWIFPFAWTKASALI
jgi:hypothetical protein